MVYARPEYVDTLATSTPIAEHVKVDYELQGCPIDKRQLLQVLGALIAGRSPRLPSGSVCATCKRRGHVCVMVARGVPCLGPVTHDGCGAICPGYLRGCYGCFGPSDAARPAALDPRLTACGASPGEILRLYGTFNAAAPAFAEGRRVSVERGGAEDRRD
jgi:coenzyme F420-reducing hydrogenase gamma subunit